MYFDPYYHQKLIKLAYGLAEKLTDFTHQIYIFKVLYFETKLLKYIKTDFRIIS